MATEDFDRAHDTRGFEQVEQGTDYLSQEEPDDQQLSERASGHRYVNMEPSHRGETSRRPQTLEDLDEIREEAEEEEEDGDEHDDDDHGRDATNRPEGCRSSRHEYVNDHQEDLDLSQQIDLLRDLLRLERSNNENTRSNNAAMKRYVQQLQMEFLKQQSDLVEALEYSHKLKAQKSSQIATIEETVREKDALIVQLQTNIANLDDSKLRHEFESNLEKQKHLAQLEQDQLRHQISTIEQQLAKEKASQNHLSQQFQQRLDDQQALHDRELAAMCSRIKQTQGELDRLLSEPQNLIIKALKEDKAALECRVDELCITTQEQQTKYDNLKRRLTCLIAEQEQSNQRNQEEVDQLHQQHAEQRRALGELKVELDDKEEIIQILQFNLQRSEKRVKNLLGVMKNKEETHRGMVAQMELKHQQEVERTRHEYESAEKRLIENGGDLNKKQNEIVRLRLEHENQLDSMRNDRDERLNRMIQDKQNLEKELKATELRLAREIEQASGKSRLVEQLHKEVKQFRNESKRLSIELTKSEAKLYAKQQEHNQLMERMNAQRAEAQAEMQDSARTQLVTFELEEEKRLVRKLNVNIEELKKENGKLNIKLRIAEANLDRMTMAINREHNKMMREYEKKLELIRTEQLTFDRSKLRYKRYGYKLKKYCEHLRRVHEHLCNPNVCGYVLGPLRAPAGTTMSPTSKGLGERKSSEHCDKMSLLSNENESEYEGDSFLDEQAEQASIHSNKCSTDDGYSTRKSNQRASPAPQPERFVVKRTGLSPVLKRTPSLRSRKLSFKQSVSEPRPRAPLRLRDPNVLQQSDTSKLLNEHEYYYINEELSYGDKFNDGSDSTCRRAIL